MDASKRAPAEDAPQDGTSDAERSPKRQRQSFLSPTRASLSRHNPDVLERRLRDAKPRTARPVVASQPTTRSTTGQSAETASGRTDTRASQSTSVTAGPGRASPTRALGGGMAAQARRTPNEFRSPAPARNVLAGPARRPSAGPGENPFLGRTLRRSPPLPVPAVGQRGPRGSARPSGADESLLGIIEAGAPESEESELPPTPTQRGIDDPIVTTPPSGIHNTPSKRKDKGKGKMKSSPLKQPPLHQSSPTRDVSPTPGNRRGPSRTEDPEGEREKEENAPHPARNIPPSDPDAARKQTRDRLKSQIARLKQDVSLAALLNDRILAAERGQKELSFNEKSVLLDLLRRTEVPKEDKETKHEKSLQEVLSLLLDPASLLGFPAARVAPQQQQDGWWTEMDGAEKPPLKTHLPITMTEEESMPFLQAFTPLRYSSRISIWSGEKENEDRPVMQRHEISVSSPDGLFHAKIEMTVDPSVPAITALAVPAVERAAEPELRTFLKSVLDEGTKRAATTTSMRSNVTIVGWAMGEWYRVALRRARVWAALERELGSKEAILESVARLRARKKRSHRRRKAGDGEGDGEQDAEVEGETRKGGKVTMKMLRPHLGRRSMDFGIPLLSSSGEDGAEEATLRCEWDIEFDWTGEARSRIGVLAGVPGKWHKTDVSGSISGLPSMFDRFVSEDGDPMAAVSTVVALLAGDVGALSG